MIKAVIVGINDYPSAPLQGCVNDADDVITYLTDVVGLSHDEILPLYDSRATKDAIVAALRDMIASSSPSDDLLFHYSGHGAQIASQDVNEPDGLDEVLCPVDFDWGKPGSAFTDKEFAAILATVPDGTALTAVLDACHSGDMAEVRKDPTQRPRFMPQPHDVAFLLKGRKVVRQRAAASTNAAVVSACQSDETAADTSFNGRANGAFTYNWLVELRGHPKSVLADLVADTAVPLARYKMHPQLDGLSALKQATFLAAPPAANRSLVLTRAPARAAAQVVFDEAWSTKVLGLFIGVELQISIVAGGFDFQLSSSSGLPLRWSFRINGDTSQQVDLGYGFSLVLAVTNWSAVASEVGFDLALRVAPPFFGPTTIAQQHVTIPVAPVSRSLVVPASPADLLAMIQLSTLGYATEPKEPPPAIVPRDGENQWTGIAAIEPFAGGLFGCRYEKNTDAYVPPGFIRDHIEVTLDPPNSGNVHFVRWEDSDPHIGRFQLHVGCSSCGGGTATFYMHCVRDPAVTRQAAPAPATIAERPSKTPKTTNGHGRSRELEMENPEGGGSIRA